MKKFSIFSIAATLLIAGCTKDISNSLNHNSKAASVGIGSALFLQGELNLVNTINTTSVSVSPFRVVSQEWTENEYVYEANYNFSAYNAPGGFWNNLFVNTIHNLDLAKQSFPVGFLGTPGQLRNDIIISDMLEIYAYYMLVATYGNIPYTQAENQTIPFPKYDDSKTVYADLLTRIDTCIAGLDISQPAMGSADQIYGSNPDSIATQVPHWLKFAASLKLKMAMLNAAKDPATATKAVTEAIATGVFTANGDDALFAYDPGSASNSNPVWNALSYSGRHDFVPAGILVTTMVGLNDPRLPLYMTNYPTDTTTYLGGTPGATNGYKHFSDFSTPFYTAKTPGDILDYTEVSFYLAEAAAQGIIITGTPAAYYDSAIVSSIEFWGGTAGQAATYLAQPSVAYATAAGTWQQKLGYQEWISNFNNNWDSWTDIRRLGFPDMDMISVPLAPASAFPVRLTYPPNETTSNPTNTAAAVAALPGGVDVVTAKLFWEP